MTTKCRAAQSLPSGELLPLKVERARDIAGSKDLRRESSRCIALMGPIAASCASNPGRVLARPRQLAWSLDLREIASVAVWSRSEACLRKSTQHRVTATRKCRVPDEPSSVKNLGLSFPFASSSRGGGPSRAIISARCVRLRYCCSTGSRPVNKSPPSKRSQI